MAVGCGEDRLRVVFMTVVMQDVGPRLTHSVLVEKRVTADFIAAAVGANWLTVPANFLQILDGLILSLKSAMYKLVIRSYTGAPTIRNLLTGVNHQLKG